jgi:hypothetical protein
LRGDSIGHCDKYFVARWSNSYCLPRKELFESPLPTPLDFCFWGWMKSVVHNKKADTRDEFWMLLLATINVKIKKNKAQNSPTTVHYG